MPRNDEHKGTSNRGFASMDQAKQRAIASKGGQSVPPEKRSFSQDPRLAAQAGRKGGESVPPEGRSFSQNRELAAEAGRKGGQARGASSARRAREKGGMKEAQSQGQEFEENRDMAAQGARNPGLPQDQMQEGRSDRQMSGMNPSEMSDEFDEDNFGRGNEDVEQGDLGQNSVRTPQGGKEHPHAR